MGLTRYIRRCGLVCDRNRCLGPHCPKTRPLATLKFSVTCGILCYLYSCLTFDASWIAIERDFLYMDQREP